MSLHSVWCAVRAARIGHFSETINLHRCIAHFDRFFYCLIDYERNNCFFNNTVQQLTLQTIPCIVWKVFLVTE